MGPVTLVLKTYQFLLLRLLVNILVMFPIVWLFTLGVNKGREWLGVYTVLTDIAFGYCALSVTMIVIDFVRKFLNHLIRYAQIASMTEILNNGGESSLKSGFSTMISRFGSVSSVYLADKVATKCVEQVTSWIVDNGRFIPDILKKGVLSKLLSSTVKTIVFHVDEVVISYMYRNPELSFFEGMGKGVSLYLQSWKSVLRSAFFSVLWLKVFGFVINVCVWVLVVWNVWEFGVLNIFTVMLTYKAVVYLFKDTLISSYESASMLIGYYAVSEGKEPSDSVVEHLSRISEGFKGVLDKNSVNEVSGQIVSVFTEGMSGKEDNIEVLGKVGKLLENTISKRKGDEKSETSAGV